MSGLPRVAVASSGLGHVARGIESWAADTAAALAPEVRLYHAAGIAPISSARIVRCVPRESVLNRRLRAGMPKFLGWRLGLGSAYEIEQFTFAVALIPHLRRDQIDVVHVQDPYLALWVNRWRRLHLVKTRVILAHGTEEPATFLNRFAYVQHLAPFHADEARAAGADRPTWTTIPNFIDGDRFHPKSEGNLRAELGIPANANVILTAAAIKRHHKRIDVLLDAFAHIPNAYLIIAGGHEADTDALVRDGTQRFGERVRFLVRFPRERMADLYRTATIFTLASLKEMMPIALLEALASGVPCVTHHHPVLTWMVGPGGITGDITTADAYAQLLETLLNDPAERAKRGAIAREHVLTAFGKEPIIAQMRAYHARVHADRGYGS